MLTFPNITPAVFNSVLDELRKHSAVSLYEPRWAVVEGNGILANAKLSPDGTLEIGIVKKPFYVSEGMIRSHIQDAIEKAQSDKA